MIGQSQVLPAGYSGAIYGKTSVEELQDLELHETVKLQQIGAFEKVQEWQKDVWSDESSYMQGVSLYLDCAKIIHA